MTNTNNFNAATSEQFGRSFREQTYTQYHLAIAHGEYDHREKIRMTRTIDKTQGCSVLELHNPASKDFLKHLTKVGEKYGWNKRKKYQDDNRDQLDAMITSNDTRLFIFQINEKDAGFCLTTTDGLELPNHAVQEFKTQRSLTTNSNAVEIYKFGLYDQYTNKGHGAFFLAEMCSILFDKSNKDIIYLNTRDTNHQGVMSFYRSNGIHSFFKETMQNDLAEDQNKATPQLEKTNG